MGDDLVIPEGVNGPPDSANGGYTCGLVAGLLDGQATGSAVQATLRQPPPLGRAMHAAIDGGQATIHDGDTLVAEAATVDVPFEGTPAAISLDDARAVAAGFDLAAYAGNHPFPTCFTCGPERTGEAADGLRIFPGAMASHVVAWPWTPDPALATADGLVDVAYVWAALDCPSGLCWFHDEPDAGPHVLGRMTAVVHRRPSPGEPLVVAGWTIATEGRKRLTGSVLWDTAGEILVDNRSTWIALDARTAGTFRPATTPPA